ncbi:hypothetical protein KKE34_03515 [Patescibacteria group bacterium]|nr:hypothetical protein [Patescibacteria group bacterium]MBU1885650.1 hypothetical protein [Patescibacteria group bacterium]
MPNTINSSAEIPLVPLTQTPEQPSPIIENEAELQSTTYKSTADKSTTDENFWNSRLVHLGQFYLAKAVVIILIIQGLIALYSSISFIFVKIPHLEQQLVSSQISQEQINALANRAIIMTISTISSLFFALKITVVQSQVAQKLNTFLAILLIIANTQIGNFLNQIGSTELITTIIIDNIKLIFSL